MCFMCCLFSVHYCLFSLFFNQILLIKISSNFLGCCIVPDDSGQSNSLRQQAEYTRLTSHDVAITFTDRLDGKLLVSLNVC